MKISILLPYKENFSPTYAGAVSLNINETLKISKYRRNTTVFGNTEYRNKFKHKYVNIPLKKIIFQSQNKKYVDDEINSVVIGAAFPRIVQGDTEVKITDNSTSGNTSKIEVTIDGALLGLWEPTRFELYQQTTDIGNVRIEGDTISGLNSNQDLELLAPGTGSVRANDSFVINNRPSVQDPAVDPLYDANGVKLYAKSPSGGDTGLYFVNTNDTRGEVISKNRALLFGLIF